MQINLHLWIKITLAMLFSIVLIVGTIIYSGMESMKYVIQTAEHEQLDGYATTLLNDIAAETRQAEALSALVANVPMFQESMKNGNREFLKQQLSPVYQKMSEKYGVRQFQFHLPPAISFFRVHKPEKFSDDLSSFRHTVNSNQQQGCINPRLGVGSRRFRRTRHGASFLPRRTFGFCRVRLKFWASFF